MKSIFFLVVTITVFLPSVLFSQWQKTSAPEGGPINTMTVSGTTLFVGTKVGVYRSTNDGASWTDAALTSTSVNALGLNGSMVFAGTPLGVYRSSDNGVSWSKANTGLTNVQVNAISSGGGVVFAGTDGGIFRSLDNGSSWIASGSFSMPVISVAVVNVGTNGKYVYAGCHGKGADNTSGLFLSTDNATTWTKLATDDTTYNGLFKDFDGTLAVAGDYIFADATVWFNGYEFVGVFFSNIADPMKWSYSSEAFTIVPYGGPNQSYLFMLSSISNASNTLGRFDARTTGWVPHVSWHELTLPSMGVRCVVTSGTQIYVATENLGLVKSTNDGGTWTSSNNGMPNGEATGIGLIPSPTGDMNIVVATNFRKPGETLDSFFLSSDKGNSWTTVKNSPGAFTGIASMPNSSGSNIALASTLRGIFRSTDGGLTWTESNAGIKRSIFDASLGAMVGVTVVGSNVFTADGQHIYRSTDYGITWVAVTNPSYYGPIWWIEAPSTGTALFILGIDKILFRSTDAGVSWAEAHQLFSIDWQGDSSTAVAANRAVLFLSGARSGVFRSYDNGDSWTKTNNGLSTTKVTDLAVVRARVFAATDGAGVFVSMDNGTTWNPAVTGLPDMAIRQLASDSSNLFVRTRGGAVLRYVGSFDPVASLAPTASSQVPSGTPFWVEVKVGDPNPVTDLETISFSLSSNQSYCTYVDSTATYGPFLTQPRPPIGTIVPLSLYWKPGPQTVSISLTWQLKPGQSGQGVVAKAQFTTPASLTSGRDVVFALNNVKATNSSGNNIDLTADAATVHFVVGGGEIWPGDCNNDGTVNAADILPIGVYYGQTLGMQNKPGMLWQGYLREGWSLDTTRKKLLADANGDGVINSVDVLPIGLNYGKTHQPVVLGKMVSPQMADGVLQIGIPENKQALGGFSSIPVILKSSKPVYGIAFDLKYGVNGTSNTSTVKLLRIDTTSTVLQGGLMVSRISNEEGMAEIGITKTQGVGAAQGALLNLVFDAPPKSPLWVEVSNVTGNDEHGNPVNLAGSVFRSDAEGATGSASVPTEYALMQNYPNPFNPATTIRFQLSDASVVSVKMFDILGREIVTLVNEERAAGSYAVRWDATGVPSGIYCCRLTARNQAGQVFIQTRRMTIVK